MRWQRRKNFLLHGHYLFHVLVDLRLPFGCYPHDPGASVRWITLARNPALCDQTPQHFCQSRLVEPGQINQPLLRDVGVAFQRKKKNKLLTRDIRPNNLHKQIKCPLVIAPQEMASPLQQIKTFSSCYFSTGMSLLLILFSLVFHLLLTSLYQLIAITAGVSYGLLKKQSIQESITFSSGPEY